MAVGAIAMIATPREEEPQISVPMIDVMAQLPGAGPEEVEQALLRPIERLVLRTRSRTWRQAAEDAASSPDGAILTGDEADEELDGDEVTEPTEAATTAQVALLQELLTRETVYFGICFGNQLFGRALGFGTYKLKYGHRGINQPVLDRSTGKVEVTAHNHGFAVDAPLDRDADTPFGRVRVSHVCLNDDVVEGLECLDVPAFSVQYHPEAAAGPHDAAYLFDRFVDLMERTAASTRAGVI